MGIGRVPGVGVGRARSLTLGVLIPGHASAEFRGLRTAGLAYARGTDPAAAGRVLGAEVEVIRWGSAA